MVLSWLTILIQEKSPVEPVSSDEMSGPATSSSTDAGIPQFPNKDTNRQVAVVSTLAALALFLSGRLDLGVSLKDLTVAALPYEEVRPITESLYIIFSEVSLLLFAYHM